LQRQDEQNAFRGFDSCRAGAGLLEALRHLGSEGLAFVGQVERVGDGGDLGDQAIGGGVGAGHGEGDACRVQYIQRFLRACAGFRQDQVGVQGEHAFGREGAEIADIGKSDD
jgi:hypothetical protein